MENPWNDRTDIFSEEVHLLALAKWRGYYNKNLNLCAPGKIDEINTTIRTALLEQAEPRASFDGITEGVDYVRALIQGLTRPGLTREKRECISRVLQTAWKDLDGTAKSSNETELYQYVAQDPDHPCLKPRLQAAIKRQCAALDAVRHGWAAAFLDVGCALAKAFDRFAAARREGLEACSDIIQSLDQGSERHAKWTSDATAQLAQLDAARDSALENLKRTNDSYEDALSSAKSGAAPVLATPPPADLPNSLRASTENWFSIKERAFARRAELGPKRTAALEAQKAAAATARALEAEKRALALAEVEALQDTGRARAVAATRAPQERERGPALAKTVALRCQKRANALAKAESLADQQSAPAGAKIDALLDKNRALQAAATQAPEAGAKALRDEKAPAKAEAEALRDTDRALRVAPAQALKDKRRALARTEAKALEDESLPVAAQAEVPYTPGLPLAPSPSGRTRRGNRQRYDAPDTFEPPPTIFPVADDSNTEHHRDLPSEPQHELTKRRSKAINAVRDTRRGVPPSLEPGDTEGPFPLLPAGTIGAKGKEVPKLENKPSDRSSPPYPVKADRESEEEIDTESSRISRLFKGMKIGPPINNSELRKAHHGRKFLDVKPDIPLIAGELPSLPAHVLKPKKRPLRILDKRVGEQDPYGGLKCNHYIYRLVEWAQGTLCFPENAAKYAIVLRKARGRFKFSHDIEGEEHLLENEGPPTAEESKLLKCQPCAAFLQ